MLFFINHCYFGLILIHECQVSFNEEGSSMGTGGMVTKLIAAELATATGCTTIICLGSEPHQIQPLIQQFQRYCIDNTIIPTIGTFFVACQRKLDTQKWWIQNGLHAYGRVWIDKGACDGVVMHKKSLFAAGIVSVEGHFSSQQCVKIMIRLA